MSFSSRKLFALMVVASVVACGEYPSNEEEDEVSTVQEELTAAQWKALSQMSRNQMILDRTAKDIGKYVGIECKPWVSKVVDEASTGVASVTQTVTSPTNMSTNAYGWALYQPSRYVIGMSTDIRNVQPGWIVQMRLHNPTTHAFKSPHTAIVVGRDSRGINFVDSNYVATNTVGTHYMTFSEIEAKTYEGGVYQYSVYYVAGG